MLLLYECSRILRYLLVWDCENWTLGKEIKPSASNKFQSLLVLDTNKLANRKSYGGHRSLAAPLSPKDMDLAEKTEFLISACLDIPNMS